jgi:hypothetical protein
MHRVVVNGPDDDLLFRLLVIVADWSDTDCDERGHLISQHVVAARARISLWYCRKLMAQALADGWLAQPRKSRPGRPGLWKLGPRCAQLRVASAHGVCFPTGPARTTARAPSVKTNTDVDVVDVRVPPPPKGAGVGPPPGRANGAVRGASAPKTDVPPAPPETVDKAAAAAHLAAAQAHLAGLRPPRPQWPSVAELERIVGAARAAAPEATVLPFKPKGAT